MPEYNPNVRLDTSQIEDVRGRGGMGRMGGMPVAVGGGTIGIIVMLVLALLGGNILGGGEGTTTSPGSYSQINNQTDQQAASTLAQRCQTGQDAANQDDCRIVLFVNSTQEFWTS